MPLPAYVANQNLKFNSILDECILVDGTVPTLKKVIRFDTLAADGQALFDAFLVAIGGVLPVLAYSGFQFVDFGGTVVGANPSGLKNDTTVYYTNVVVDGTNHAISVTGSASQTFTLVVATLNTALGAAATAAISGGNISITSTSTGNVSTILIDNVPKTFTETSNVLTVIGQVDVDNSLFRNLTGMKTFQTPINGATGLTEALQLNYIPTKTLNYTNDFSNGETFYNLWRGLIISLPPKPTFPGTGFPASDVYWGDPAGGTAYGWKYLINDAVANPPPS